MPGGQVPPPTPPDLLQVIREDFRAVRGKTRQQKAAVFRDFEELESFYLSPADRERLARMGAVRRWLFRIPWLMRSLFLKLTPSRRVLFVASVILFAFSFDIDIGGGNSGVRFQLPALGVAVLLLILMLELKDKLLARDELEEGRSVQRALMSEAAPLIPGWEAWLWTRPANDVGGDLVDSLKLDDERYGLVLADVAGKGLPAALLMAKVQATLRALAPDSVGLGDLGARVNRILCRDGLPNRFATLVYLEVSPGSRVVRFVNGGHMPPIVLRPGGIEEMPLGSVALGILRGATYTEQSLELQPGEMLVVYSDGVTEAMDKAGEFFGDERLRALLPGFMGLPPQEAAARLVAAVDAFVGEARPHDDLSVIVLKRA